MSSDPESGSSGALPAATLPSDGDARASWQDPRLADAHDREGVRDRVRERLLGVRSEPTTIGRFHILRRVGEGGMGTVYAAHDDRLDRKVALKVIRGEASPGRRARMLREAQAMAKLNHPNVVAVYEIGEVDEAVHIAMEFIRGESLRQWVKGRSWREVLEVFLQAGRGIAAAHAAGLVHRDFKPENVMVDEEGRARVLDFGLAQVEATPHVERETALASDSLERPLTVTGARLGTPAYMAPEQIRGEKADPLSDQFSFCVSLYEALWGCRPFAAHGLVELVAKVERGEVAKPPKGTGVPGWLWPIVARGLSVDRAQRWPSMKALCDVLARGAGRRRRQLAMVTSIAASLLLASLGVGWTLDRDRRRARCVAEGDTIAEVWNEATKAALRSALLQTGSRRAGETADKVMPWLDAQAAAWQQVRTETCLAAEVDGTWDADARDRSNWCLDERRMELAALVGELSSGHPRVLDEAVHGAARASRVDSCRDRDLLMRLPTPPEHGRDELQSVRSELARAAALEATGAFGEGLEVARGALSRSEELAWPPLIAATRYRVGRLLERTGEVAEAEQQLEAAFFEAVRAGAPELAVDVAVRLVHVVGYRLARPAEGTRWFHHAELVLESLPDAARLRQAALLNSLAISRQAAGALDEARSLHERVLAISEEALGPAHPDIASSLTNLGNVHAALGAPAEAKTLHERALKIVEEALGRTHPAVAASLNNLAIVHQSMREYERATLLHERGLAIREETLGPDHLDVAQSLNNLAVVHQARGAHDQAKPLFERALAIRERVLGPDHPQVAASLNNLADLHQATGAHVDARSFHERALSVWERSLGAEHPAVSYSLLGLAEVALAEGRAGEAVGLAERAALLREAGMPSTPELAEARFVLARALWEVGTSERAVVLAEQARDAYRASAQLHGDELTNVVRWLETRTR